MVQRIETLVTLVDDLDGSKADRTVSFSYDGADYEMELSRRNAVALEKALAPYVAAARRVKAPRSARGRRSSARSSRADLRDVRDWANANGWQVSPRGRIPTEVQDAYAAAH